MEGQHNLRQFQLQLQYLTRQSRATHKGSRASWLPQRRAVRVVTAPRLLVCVPTVLIGVQQDEQQAAHLWFHQVCWGQHML
jgi:hypothetical protein